MLESKSGHESIYINETEWGGLRGIVHKRRLQRLNMERRDVRKWKNLRCGEAYKFTVREYINYIIF